MEIDNPPERWSGREMTTLSDFKRKIIEHFHPLSITIEFHGDGSGLCFIRVDNGDGTFQLYEHHSSPSQYEILTEIFRKDGAPPIVDIVLTDTIPWTEAEQNETITGICKRHGVDRVMFSDALQLTFTDDDPWTAACAEYRKWLDDGTPISLVREGDYGSKKDDD